MIGGYIGLDIGGVAGGGLTIAPAAAAGRVVIVKAESRTVKVEAQSRTVIVKS